MDLKWNNVCRKTTSGGKHKKKHSTYFLFFGENVIKQAGIKKLIFFWFFYRMDLENVFILFRKRNKFIFYIMRLLYLTFWYWCGHILLFSMMSYGCNIDLPEPDAFYIKCSKKLLHGFSCLGGSSLVFIRLRPIKCE